ncbi:uncharacterized protein Dvir_GJ12027 [Drosophila virilis]|uniref:Peptidase S1 domain-containing protein n=1 Tax=Drosophila virilis TaxID=7244 RepID=B4LHR2_DROVI|nr:serine protease 1 [Drosophila virilis]EDW69615.1 uncharacterized protein Dvir_GJ12027 [Drosophila virilis]
MKQLALFLFLAFALVNGNEPTEDQADPENIISNGYSAYEGKAPYMVSLVLGSVASSATSLCGGAIIANNWVLTAAQCLTRDFVEIHYGSYTRRGQFAHRVGKGDFHVQDKWPKEKGYDIGLIRTPYVEFTFWVNKVNLPSSNADIFDNKWAVACGWGEQANGQVANWLQCVDLEIMGSSTCSRYYGSVNAGVLCARTPEGKSTCGGDIGGPLVTYDNHTVAGVTSFFSAGGCRVGHPAGFTSVAAHLDWISTTIGLPSDNIYETYPYGQYQYT